MISEGAGFVLLLTLVLPAEARPQAGASARREGAGRSASPFTGGVRGTSSEGDRRSWPGFRGPGARGCALHAEPPLGWSAKEGKGILWKTPVPTHGMSSPVVWGKRVFLTGADDSSRQVYCFGADDGKPLWRHEVDGLPGFPSGSELPRVLDETGYAAPTATTNGEQVAAIFATGELVCVDMDGKRVWAKHLGVPRNPYGHASSLLSRGNLLFVQLDQKAGSRLLTFDLATGRPVWEAKRGDATSWASPILIENQGRSELVLVSCTTVDGYDPATGKPLWSVECLDGEVAASAAYADGVVFVSNDGATTSAIDIRKHAADPEILWEWDENLPDAASPLAKDGYVIVPTAFGVVTCLEARTGKVLWEKEFDRGFCSSPVAVGDRVYMADVSGTTQIFRLGGEFESLGVGEVGEGVYATPAFVGDRVYIRGLMHLFCVRAKGK